MRRISPHARNSLRFFLSSLAGYDEHAIKGTMRRNLTSKDSTTFSACLGSARNPKEPLEHVSFINISWGIFEFARALVS